jgi:hypothetical protein
MPSPLALVIAGVIAASGVAVTVDQVMNDDMAASTATDMARGELVEVASFASLRFMADGGTPDSALTDAVTHWHNIDKTGPELGVPVQVGPVLTYTGDAFCWQLTVTDSGANALTAVIVPC